MLVLSRKTNERVVISVPPSAEPTEVVVQVVDIHGGKARLGIQAPKTATIHREEVAQRIAAGTTDTTEAPD